MSHRHPGYTDSGFQAGYAAARILPRCLCQFIGGILGTASYLSQPEARQALADNLARVTGYGDLALQNVCHKNFRNFGRMLADYFYCTGKTPETIRGLLDEWHGLDNVSTALAGGKGVILVTAHIGNWELGGTLLALDGWPINVVTLPEPTSGLTRTREAYRKELGIRTIAIGDKTFAFVEMIAALNRNEIVCMLVDRPYGETGTPVEFFNRETCFSSAPALLHQHTGAAIVPAFVLQNKRRRYQAFAQAALPLDTPSDRSQRRHTLQVNTQRIASAFEAIIRPHPEQWFNYVPIWK